MHKKGVLYASLMTLNYLEKLRYRSRDSGACDVIEHSSGKYEATVSLGDSIGSNYGLLRAVPSGYYQNYLAIANQNLTESRITGLNKSQRSVLTTVQYNM
jgi:hypothetical protein